MPEFFPLIHYFRGAAEAGEGASFLKAHPELLTLGTDDVGETALHFVVIENEMQAVRDLLAAGADTNHPDKRGNTPLMSAAGLGYSEMVVLLLEAGADPTATNDEGETALHLWVRNPDESILRALMRKGADLNAEDKLGETPLIRAGGWEGYQESSGPVVPLGAKMRALGVNLSEELVSELNSLKRKPRDFKKAQRLLLEAGAEMGDSGDEARGS